MYIKSPLNYTGGKYKLLSQIMSSFPSECDTFKECDAKTVEVLVTNYKWENH